MEKKACVGRTNTLEYTLHDRSTLFNTIHLIIALPRFLYFCIIKKENNFQFSNIVNCYIYASKKRSKLSGLNRHQREMSMFEIRIMLEHCRLNAVGLQTGFDV